MQQAALKRSTACRKEGRAKVAAVPNESQVREDRVIYRAVGILEKRLRKPGYAFSDPASTRAYLHLTLSGKEVEHFVGLFLDSQHRLIAVETLSTGTLDAASVYPREVAKHAIRLHAAAVIFAHNHPSGVADPSEADRLLTDRLRYALALIDVRVVDHFVIGSGAPTSFAERGWL
ncbi:MAG: RadC family protein [Panacagrimonas sp.]